MMKGVTLNVYERILQSGLTLRDFFTLDNGELCSALGLSSAAPVDKYSREQALFNARKEEEFMKRHSIRAVFIGDKEYPWRMSHCADAPLLLYVLGDCDLNGKHIMSVVGTRKITPYGSETCKRVVSEMADSFSDLCVVSGLAYGTDSMAHITSLEKGVKTVAVVAHGLNTIYPAANRDLAKRIIQSGGAIISEYPSGTSAYRQHFLARNRIVAWMCDVTLVIESEVKGGAMSTANYAFRENRDVLAIPGRVTDVMSAGCNHLISRNKAGILTEASDILRATNWSPEKVIQTPVVGNLFPEIDGEEKIICDVIRGEKEPISADELHVKTGIQMSRLASLLAEMEFDGILLRYPGNRYSLG